jgi:hypothetical protein
MFVFHECSASPATCRTDDGTYLVASLPKAAPGVRWKRLFVGDSDAAREHCIAQPSVASSAVRVPGTGESASDGGSTPLYTVSEGDDDTVVVDVALPRWVTKKDVTVSITPQGVDVAIPGLMSIKRTFWYPTSGQDGG